MAINDNLQDYLTAMANSFRYATNSTEKINAQDMLLLPAQLGDAYKDLQTMVSRPVKWGNINVPLGINSVGAYAYYSTSTTYADKISIPEGVKYIMGNAFGNVYRKEVHLPSTLVSVRQDAFFKSAKGDEAIVYYNGTLKSYLELESAEFWKGNTHEDYLSLDIEGNMYINNEIVKNVVVPKEIKVFKMPLVFHREGVLTFEENSQVENITALPCFSKIYLPKGPYQFNHIFNKSKIDELHYDGTMVDYLNLTWGYANTYNFFSSGIPKIYFKNVLQDKIIIPEGVISIPQQAFYKFDKSVKEVIIASTVVEVQQQGFNANSSSSNTCVRLLGTTPPTRQTNSFSNVGKFIVPASALNTYKSATNWTQDASKIFPDSNIEVSIDSSLLNNENILYSVDGGAKQQFTNTTLSLEGVGTLTIYNTSTDTIKLGKTSGGTEVGTSGPSTTITYTFTDVSTLYITKA